jgi:hypothetical protein
MDTVDCAVAPMSACHLLLGRPWQFDVDATHGGRSNNYSFVHKGVPHVLKPMADSAIMAEVFATSKVKKKNAEISPKPRTALLQEGENGVNISILADDSESKHIHEPIKPSLQFGSISNNIFGNTVAMTNHTLAAKAVSKIHAQLNEPLEHDITIEENSCVIINSWGEASDGHSKEFKTADTAVNKSLMQYGSLTNIVAHKDNKKDEDLIVTKMNKPVKIMPKPRMALFQGREDDEPMAPQHSIIISKKTSKLSNMFIPDEFLNNSMEGHSFTKFGDFYTEMKHVKKEEVSIMASKLIFEGSNFRKRHGFKIKRFILIGEMHVELPS